MKPIMAVVAMYGALGLAYDLANGHLFGAGLWLLFLGSTAWVFEEWGRQEK